MSAIITTDPVEKITNKWIASPNVQKPFLESDADEIAIGGAPGGGKSAVMHVKAYIRQKQNPGISTVFIRNHLHELEDPEATIPAMKEMFGGLMEWKEQKKRFIVPNDNGMTGEIKMMYAETEADVYSKFKNFQCADMYIDQAEGFTGEQILYMKHRLRTTKDCKPLLHLSFNPCGVGHNFLMDRYIIPSYGGGTIPDKIVGKHHQWTAEIKYKDITRYEKREFIPAKYSDNPDPKIAEQYLKNLLELPISIREAFIEGRWDLFKGKFWVEYDEAIHLKEWEVNPKYPQFEAGDWGFAVPFAVGFAQEMPDGSIFIFDELHQAGLLYYQQAQKIIAKREQWGTDPYIHKFDPVSMKRKDGSTGITLEEEYANHGVYLTPADNARIPGWMISKTKLQKREVFIHPRLEHLRRSLNEMIYDKDKHAEDLKKGKGDHPSDWFRYLLCDARVSPVIDRPPVSLYNYQHLREQYAVEKPIDDFMACELEEDWSAF